MSIQPFALLLLVASWQAGAQESREYKTWSACKVGSWIKLKTDIEKASGTGTAEQTTTLVDVTPGKLILEQTGTVTAKGKTTTLPVQKLEVTPAEDAGGKVVKKGDEELSIAGKKLKCHWEQIDIEGDGQKSSSKVWTSPDVPGGLVKMETRITGKGAQTIKVVLLEWEKK
jgi:hypothetical protein